VQVTEPSGPSFAAAAATLLPYLMSYRTRIIAALQSCQQDGAGRDTSTGAAAYSIRPTGSEESDVDGEMGKEPDVAAPDKRPETAEDGGQGAVLHFDFSEFSIIARVQRRSRGPSLDGYMVEAPSGPGARCKPRNHRLRSRSGQEGGPLAG
jgi:hypothetical protein